MEVALHESYPRFYVSWLPNNVKQEALQEEPQRFRALSEAICAAAKVTSQSGQPGAYHQHVIPFIPILNNFLDSHQLFSPAAVVPLAHALHDVVCSTSHDLEVQVRTAECLSKLLQTHKRVLSKPLNPDLAPAPSGGAPQPQLPPEADGSPAYVPPLLVLPWRPLFDVMIKLYGDPPPVLEGVGLSATRQNSLIFLITRCRRYFEPGAVVELWELLRPCVTSVSHALPEAYQALGWMALFAPTNMIHRCGTAVANQLLNEWMSAWSLLACNPAWDALWAGLLGRLAKHDWKGQLDWQPHLAVLFTHMVGMFELPVGSATNAPMTMRPPPARAQAMFTTLLTNLPHHMARLAVHLLRACPLNPATAARAAGVSQRLVQLAALLDNYMHPSNTGRWTKSLTGWLSRLVDEFMQQVGKQGASPGPWSSFIPPATFDVFVDLATSLAARAQFSKDEGLSQEAVACLASLAYIRPGRVLPLVVSRFRAALESATATHQLCAAITCLARCVRPLLLSGWGLEEETGPQLLAEALVALLPGLDANDEAKTLAVIHLYVAVLSTAPGIGSESELEGEVVPGSVCIPVFVEDWSEDVITRITTLLGNLDSGPGHRSTDAAHGRGGGGGAGAHAGGDTFLIGHNSLFSQLIELLVSRLPKSVAVASARRISSFAASETLPGVDAAISTMLAEVAQHHPGVVVELFVRPVLSRLARDLAGAGGAEATMHEISPALEATVCYQANLVQAVLWHLPQSHSQDLTPAVQRVVDLAFLVSSRQVQDAGSSLLRGLCHAMVEIQLNVPVARPAPLGPGGALLLEWVDRTGSGVEPMSWTTAPADGPARAQQLMETYLLQPAQRLAAAAANGGAIPGPGSAPASRLATHAELLKMKGVLAGLLSHLDDFQLFLPPKGPSDVPLCLAGNMTPVLGRGMRLREALALQLTEIGKALYGQHDPEALGEYLVVVEMLLCLGTLEYSDSRAMGARGSHRNAMMEEPAAAGLLIAANMGDAAAATAARPWRKRMSQLAAVAQVYNMVTWRNSQAAFRHWATTATPQVTQAAHIGPEFRALLECACAMTTHPLRQVRAEATTVLGPVLTRFGVLTYHTLPHFFATLSDVAAPPELGLAAAASGPALTAAATAFQQRLLAGALRDVAAPAGVQLEPLPANGSKEETQGVQEARVEGAVQVICHCLPYWRLMCRDTVWHQSLLYTIMASRTHNSTISQGSLGTLLINVLSRHLKPPTLDHASTEYAQFSSVMLHLAHPDTLRSSWRYSLTANVLCLVLQPPPSSGAPCLPFARHLLSLLQPGCMLQLGKLAITGLSMMLARIVEYGEDNAQLVSDVSSWLSLPGSGAAVATLFASNHGTLEASEAGADSRGGVAAMQARLLNMTHEDFMLRVVAASLDKGGRWPEGGTPELQPAGVSQGLFVISHAQLVRLLATVAPAATTAALRPVLDQAELAASEQRVASTSDKTEQAAAAECASGLLAAGVHVGQGPDATWLVEGCRKQLMGCTLELSEAWAVTLRYALYVLLDIGHPTCQLSRHLTNAPGPRTPLSPQQALSGLSLLLDLSRASGPEPAYIAYAGSIVPAGAAAGAAGAVGGQVAVMKRLRYVYQCMRELLTCPPSANTPPQVMSFWLSVAVELLQTLEVDVLSLRTQLGKMMGLMVMQLGTSARCSDEKTPAAAAAMDADIEMVMQPEVQALDGTASPAASEQECDLPSVRRAVKRLEEGLVAAFAAGSGAVQALKQNAAGEAATAKASGEPGGNGGNGSTGSSTTDSDVVMVDRPASPLPLPDDESFKSTPQTSRPATPNGQQGPGVLPSVPLDTHVSVSQVGLGLAFIAWSSMHANLVVMQPLLYTMLPHLFRLQELAGPILQKLSHEALLALALAKYWPPPTDVETLQQVLDCLSEAAAPAPGGVLLDMWSTRAAALSYAQNWWFRTCFLLPASQAVRLRQLVQDRLADSKPEVRVMAGATLSGMLRGMSFHEVEALRSQFVRRAQQQLVPRKRPAPAAPGEGSAQATAQALLEKHAIIQGLTAFLQSSPYDCPAWLPPVLLALVRPAAAQHGTGLEAALRTAASKALSEFKRTHEQDSMDKLRSMMSEDEWDSLQQATSSASYFS